MNNNTVQIAEETEDVLKALDYVLLFDHSGSMNTSSIRLKGKTRLEEVQEDAFAIANAAEKYDDDGITVIAFSSSVNVRDSVKASAVQTVFQEFSPRGNTNLAAAIDAATEKARASTKETVVIVYTDGEPTSEDDAIAAINKAAAELGRPKIGFVFLQVGDDPDATKFLKKLDTELKVDICSTIPFGQSENLSLGQLAWLGRHS